MGLDLVGERKNAMNENQPLNTMPDGLPIKGALIKPLFA
jgi:hypothetical protein